MPEQTVTLKRKKECKHSIVFETRDEDVPVNSVYVNRTVPGIETAETVTLTLQVGE